MANDIIGGPEPIIIKGRFFKFSPLTDSDFSWLDAWVSFRLEKKAEALSEEGFTELQSFAGCAQLLYLSIVRNEPIMILELGELLIDDAEACKAVFDFWYTLNFEVEWPKLYSAPAQPTGDKTTRKQNANFLYTTLSMRYRWTPQQIASLTPYQQLAYAQRCISSKPDELTFGSVESYNQWLQDREQNNV